MVASRRQARERALELLYEAEIRGLSVDDLLAAQVIQPDPFTQQLVEHVGAAREVARATIQQYAQGWDVSRMPAIDVLILRIAMAELADPEGPPDAVVINEAVELAKKYSTERSGAFVNGVLSKLRA